MRSDDSSSSSRWPASGIGRSSAEAAAESAPIHRYAALLGAIDQAYLFGELIRDEYLQPVDFLVLEVNPAFESLTGVSQQEASGAIARDLFPCDLAQWFLTAFGRVVSNREQLRLESSIPLGGRFYQVSAMPDEGDRFAALFTVVDSQHLAARAANRAPNLLWTTNSQGALDWCNRRWIDYSGQQFQQARDTGWHATIHPDDLPLFRLWLTEGMREGTLFSRQFRCRHRDGGYRWLQLSLAPDRDPVTGEMVRWYGSGTDVHECRTGVEALREQQTLLGLALDAGELGAWVYDSATDTITASRVAQDIFQSPTNVFPASYWRSVVLPEDLPRLEEQLRAALAGECPYELEYRTSIAGRVRWVRSRGRVIPARDGTTQVIGVSEDITARKHAEEALHRTNESLEQFAYLASHDLKEPLRMITGFAELLALDSHTAQDEKTARYLQILLGGARRMQHLVDDLLAFARMVGGGGESLDLVDCNQVLELAIGSLHRQIEECSARIVSDPLPIVNGQASLLAQVFQNLLANSMNYRNPSRACEIHIAGERREREWIICVQDNGTGFDPSECERIFKPFVRLQRRDTPGSGMGLALCRRIVEHHNGRIWAESQPGVGASFFIALPAPDATPNSFPGLRQTPPVPPVR